MRQEPPCAAKNTSSGPAVHISARHASDGEISKPPASPSCPPTDMARVPETAINGIPGSPQPSSNPGLLQAHGSEASEACAAHDEDGQAPSPLPSCFPAISIGRAQEMVQGLADDLNPRPVKLALEPAAPASAAEDASGASPGQAQPSVCTAQAGGVDVAAATGQSLQVNHPKTAPIQTNEEPGTAVSTKAAKGTKLSEPSGHVQVSSDTREGGQKLIAAAAAEEDTVLPCKDVVANGAALDKTAGAPTMIITQSAAPTGKDASAEVPACDTRAQAAAQPVTPATSSNASQQCNADASMVSQADCQQDAGSAQGGEGGNLQASHNSQDHAALDQGKSHTKQAAAIGGACQATQHSQGLAAHEKSSNDVAEAAAHDPVNPAASGLDRLERSHGMSPVRPGTADATASRQQVPSYPRKHDRRKSSVPAR